MDRSGVSSIVPTTSSIPFPVPPRFRPAPRCEDHRPPGHRRRYPEVCRRHWSQAASPPRNYRLGLSYFDRRGRCNEIPKAADKMATVSVVASSWRCPVPRCGNSLPVRNRTWGPLLKVRSRRAHVQAIQQTDVMMVLPQRGGKLMSSLEMRPSVTACRCSQRASIAQLG